MKYLSRLRLGQRVLVGQRLPGTVARLCSDGSAWVRLDARSPEVIHPFPADDAHRGHWVQVFPEQCSGEKAVT